MDIDDLREIPQNISTVRLDCLNIEIGSTSIVISAEGVSNRLNLLLLWTSQSTEEIVVNKMTSFSELGSIV